MVARFQAVVVGMGPAGLAAAIELAQNGVQTAIMDQAQSPGGQVYRQPPGEFAIGQNAALNPRKLAGRMLLEQFGRVAPRLNVIKEATVWGSFEPHSLSLLRNGNLTDLRFNILIICEGAKERVIPFPGWTLPGVMTTGGLQKMLTNQGLLPGRRILLCGSGPLLMAVGASLARAGGGVVSLCEAASLAALLSLLPQLIRQKGLLGESRSYLAALCKGRVPVRPGWAVIAAHGDERVRAATICRVDKDWRPIGGTQRTLDVDAVAVGFGFQALSRLTRLCGCRLVYDLASRSFKPKTDSFQRTSRPEIYTAGDAAGIGGAAMAEIQGRIAGLHGAFTLGKLSRDSFDAKAGPWLKHRRNTQRYVDRLDRIFTPRDGIYEIMDQDTLICRCESVSAGRVWEYAAEGHPTLVKLKSSRLAMGPCQGRGCESIAVEMLRLKGVDPNQIDPLGLRPPLSPIPLAVFEDYTQTGGD